jgi:hypothetical protein
VLINNYVITVFQRPVTDEKSPVGPWLLALFVFVVCGSGEHYHNWDYHNNYHIVRRDGQFVGIKFAFGWTLPFFKRLKMCPE